MDKSEVMAFVKRRLDELEINYDTTMIAST